MNSAADFYAQVQQELQSIDAQGLMKRERVLNALCAMRGGRDNDPRFGSRMRGEGLFANLLKRRFEIARKRLGFATREEHVGLRCDLFRAPARPKPASPQGDLFG